MPKHLSKNNRLLVVSDTGMVQKNGKMYAFGPVVKELQEMLKLFETITWIGFNRSDQLKNASYIEISSKNIKTIALSRVGGKSVVDKMNIIASYPKMWSIIHLEIKKHQFIHSRAPSNPAYITMLLSKKYPSKQFWFKYAGNWIEKTSFFYDLQRKKLKKLASNCTITVNGTWENQPSNIVAFENPCLTLAEREEGLKTTNAKNYKKPFTFCFVGRLDELKGMQLILNSFGSLKSLEKVEQIHFIGDGPKKEFYELKCKQLGLPVTFHGFINRQEVFKIYKQSHFIVLPSKSEGFPKVIAEAMNYGCIPIVSDVSCIGQYINTMNGYIINPLTTGRLAELINLVINETENDLKKKAMQCQLDTAHFTYDHYTNRIQNDIFELIDKT